MLLKMQIPGPPQYNKARLPGERLGEVPAKPAPQVTLG
jgi:hypothetical protein